MCIYYQMLQIETPLKYCSFDAMVLMCFHFPLFKAIWKSCKMMPFNASAIFFFTTLQNVYVWGLFLFWVNMADGQAGSCRFWSKHSSCNSFHLQFLAHNPLAGIPGHTRQSTSSYDVLRRFSKMNSWILTMISSI